MLKHLHIQNYALISHLDIDFADGFSVMTGETGAGKSIILGALALVLGARADSKAITDGEDKCIIEAEFTDCIIRRELYSNGKSRSFVDDSVVTLQELKETVLSRFEPTDRKIIGGYSLAGLFVLWVAYREDYFGME